MQFLTKECPIIFLGCPTEEVDVPFDTKEFNLTDYLTIARENFIGRRWLYEEIEDALFSSRKRVSGVLIIGDPGAGKSALAAQLVCSRTSSRTIHDHILGYHVCKHSERNTQNGGKFVRNLADMIARRLPEYGYIVTNNSYIQRSLSTDCVTLQDPVGCFEQAILSPLRLLKNKPKENWYIVIDALDECLTQSETGHSIVYLLNNKLPRFPSWLKLVMTSRNESSVSINSNSVTKLIIDPDDIRNIEDIELFLSTKLLQDGPLINRIKLWFGDNSIKSTARLISALLSKSQGNFLFVKEMLHHWETSRAEKRDPYALPETLGDLYHSYFERLYSRKEQFRPIRRVLELLVATFHPLSLKGIYEVLKTKEENLEEEYEFKDRINGLGHFLRYGENDTVTLYHLSLTEWLISENNKNSPFYVSKKKGHEMFCDYYLILIADGDKSSLLKYILTLAQHITYGGWKGSYVKQFLKFPSQVVNSSDPTSNRTLLHLAATINSTDVMELLLRHFSCIDCIDNRGITPAFLAAEHGLVNNLALMVSKGAKVNRKTKSLLFILESKGNEYDEFVTKNCLWTPVLQSKSKYWGSTMLHAAAHRGHMEVVAFLLDNGAFISTVDGVNLTALQIAAENGHSEVVKALYNAGAVADQTSLHHAAANGRLEVVKYLLKIGVRDRCIRCDGSFYWLKTLKHVHRLQSNMKTENVMSFHINEQCFADPKQIEKNHCIEKKTENTTNFGELYDDKHLIFCQTALHAGVSAGHVEVVRELISSPPTALTCRDYTGRTALHEAVRKNNSEIVKMILKKDPALIHETCNHWQMVEQRNETHTSLKLGCEESIEYHGDICHCGYTPLHMAARYGHWEIGMYLIKISGALVNASDCFGATPLHVAACHNHKLFVHMLMRSESSANINSMTANGSTPLHSAAACGAVEIIDLLLYFGANLSAVDKGGLSTLHYAILHIHPDQLDGEFIINRTDLGGALHLVTIDRRGHLAMFYENENNIIRNTDQYRWLDAFINLILRGSDIHAADVNGRTPLHIASANGLADAVNVLLQRKSQLELRDNLGKTPLEVAVENCTVSLTTSHFNEGEQFHDLQQHLRDHEMVVYLLLSSGASFRKCSRNGTSLLHNAIAKRKPYIARLLLLKGARLSCKDSLGRTPLMAFIQNGGDWADFPFNVSFNIECGKPFQLSTIHLLCYFPPKLEENNFFQLITCDDQTCSSRKPPFQSAIERHKLKHRVIDNCLDAEGFTPLHRAAQGANLVGVRSLLKTGANLTLLSPQGQDAITLAILHSGGTIGNNLLGNEELLARKDNASLVALQLLHQAMKTRGFQIVCDPSKPELTLYHLAASRGLVKFIQEMFKEKEQHKLDVNCPNKDGVTPLYLANVFSFEAVKGESYNPWKEVIRIIKDHGGIMMLPSKDVELNIIYKRLFGWIPDDLKMNLRGDVRGFVLELVSTFQNWQKNTSHCKLEGLNGKSMEIGSPSSLKPVWNELLRQLDILNLRGVKYSLFGFTKLVSLALDDLKVCKLQIDRSEFYTKKLSLLTSIYRSVIHASKLNNTATGFRHRLAVISESIHEIVLEATPVYFFYLMRLWHHEVFQHFACIKKVVDRYRRFFFDDNHLKQLIAKYEESTPTWMLTTVCSSLQNTFETYLLSYLSKINYTEFTALYHEYPDFIKKRMGWTVQQFGNINNSWPFDFLVKFTLGLYRQYKYLKILNVGLEPGTHVVLPSKRIKQAKVWEKAQHTSDLISDLLKEIHRFG